MRVPQRLQMQARCLVFRTGTFLNIVEISNRMEDSFIGRDCPAGEQGGCHAPPRSLKLNDFRVLFAPGRFSSGLVKERLHVIGNQFCTNLARIVQL